METFILWPRTMHLSMSQIYNPLPPTPNLLHILLTSLGRYPVTGRLRFLRSHVPHFHFPRHSVLLTAAPELCPSPSSPPDSHREGGSAREEPGEPDSSPLSPARAGRQQPGSGPPDSPSSFPSSSLRGAPCQPRVAQQSPCRSPTSGSLCRHPRPCPSRPEKAASPLGQPRRRLGSGQVGHQRHGALKGVCQTLHTDTQAVHCRHTPCPPRKRRKGEGRGKIQPLNIPRAAGPQTTPLLPARAHHLVQMLLALKPWLLLPEFPEPYTLNTSLCLKQGSFSGIGEKWICKLPQ